MEWVFNHKNIHQYAWEQHTKNLKTIIDNIISKQDLKLKIQDIRAYRGGQWLRGCATNLKVAGSIPDGVIGIFY